MPVPHDSGTCADTGLRSELLTLFAADQDAMRAFLADADSHRERFERTQTTTSGTPWPYALLEWDPPQEAPLAAQRVVATVAQGEAHPRHLAAVADSLRLSNDEPPEFASLSEQYPVERDGELVFRWDVDRAAIDERRAAIGPRPLATDLARHQEGGSARAIGTASWEPWPAAR